eukprot:6948-Heterococcus_DN1.PRE.7
MDTKELTCRSSMRQCALKAISQTLSIVIELQVGNSPLFVSATHNIMSESNRGPTDKHMWHSKGDPHAASHNTLKSGKAAEESERRAAVGALNERRAVPFTFLVLLNLDLQQELDVRHELLKAQVVDRLLRVEPSEIKTLQNQNGSSSQQHTAASSNSSSSS